MVFNLNDFDAEDVSLNSRPTYFNQFTFSKLHAETELTQVSLSIKMIISKTVFLFKIQAKFVKLHWHILTQLLTEPCFQGLSSSRLQGTGRRKTPGTGLLLTPFGIPPSTLFSFPMSSAFSSKFSLVGFTSSRDFCWTLGSRPVTTTSAFLKRSTLPKYREDSNLSTFIPGIS